MFAATSLTRKPSVLTLLLVSVAFAATCRPGIAAEQHAPPGAANPQEKSADTKSAPPKGAATLCDINCAKRATDAAGQACVPLIEAKAPIDYDWLARPFGGIFQEVERSPTSSIVSYRGDAVRFLTPQNQWIRVTYECGYDVALAKIVFVNVRPGRLDRPASASLEQPNDQKPPALANAQRPAPQPAPQLLPVAGQQPPNQPGNLAASPLPPAALPPPAGKTPAHYGEPSAIDISQLPARR